MNNKKLHISWETEIIYSEDIYARFEPKVSKDVWYVHDNVDDDFLFTLPRKIELTSESLKGYGRTFMWGFEAGFEARNAEMKKMLEL